MARHFRTPDITVRIPFGTAEPERIALLRAAGVPLDARGDIARGFMHERRPYRFGADTICHWLGTGDTTPGAAPEPPQGA